MFPDTVERVPRHTSRSVNAQIEARLSDSIRWHAAHPEAIDRRLRDLDSEWDTERTLEANAATLALAGTALGVAADRRWLALPMVVTAFLLQHAVQGWCPPLPILRRLGFRTAREIDIERNALKALRGDFASLSSIGTDKGRRAHEAELAARA